MRKSFAILIILTLTFGVAADSYGNVSSAAVLFLRIAAGARAAGMGEAFVAVADDATTTHWNPAGLGTYPLSSKWFEIKVPEYLQPIKKMAILKNESFKEDYKSYDIWALSKLGLVKFNPDDNSHLSVIDPQVCRERCPQKFCTHACPAQVYRWETEENLISVAFEGCLECGSCRIACPHLNIEWRFPTGGFGISHKFG